MLVNCGPNMTYPQKHYGISCPAGGKFYLQGSSTIPFIGCCTADFITNACPGKDTKPMAFKYDGDIPAQDCVQDDALWYTCSNTKPTFIGCCAINPCTDLGCPDNELRTARLSKKESNAKEFLGVPSSSTTTATTTRSTTLVSTTSISSASSSTSSSATSPPNPPTSSEPSTDSSQGLSSGSIAGIAVGSIAGALGLGLFFFWIYRLARKQSPVTWHASPTDDQLERKWTPGTPKPNPATGSMPPPSPLPYVASGSSSSMLASPVPAPAPAAVPAATDANSFIAELPGTPLRQVSSIVSSTWSQPSQSDVAGLFTPSQDHIRRYEGMNQ